ncbi:long-chain fatty acid transport protein [Enterobacter cloacae]|uniref:Long-chain fatty acid transport protein n=1 Tax=Enterobacter cloacae TaxID=550 RepID=A0A377LV53_ENTCL|nr:long-chain fatty acid transport protein [Enterobacter cloacae]
MDITGRSPSGASLNSDNIAPTAWCQTCTSSRQSTTSFGWGASVTSNYGLATEFNNDYAAGAYGGKTDLETLNLNLSGAYRLNSNWSFGVGFDAVYAKAKIERYAGDLGKIVAGSGALPPPLAQQVAGIPADTQIAYLKGDEWGFGWNAGILYELDKNTVTVSPTVPK